MRESRVKEVWSHGHIAVGSLIKSTDPVHTEVISQLGLDLIWIDLEHSDKNVETFAQLTRAARIGTSDIMARPARWGYMRMGRMLEARCPWHSVPEMRECRRSGRGGQVGKVPSLWGARI